MSIQTNIKPTGKIKFNSGEDLSLYSGRAVTGIANGSELEVILPLLESSDVHFIVDDGGALDADSELIPLVFGEERRLVAKGTIAAGATVVLADPSTSADKGKIRTLPATEGRYTRLGIAEEAAVDGQHVRVRINPGPEFVGEAFTGAAPAATAATSSTPFGYSEAQANAIKDTVIELHAWAVANGFKAASA
jgi:hypothetical protein